MDTAQYVEELDWHSLLEKMTLGFAVHRVIRDKKGKVIDCLIVAVNKEFEILTGHKRNQVEGALFSKTIKTGGAGWISRYAKVVDTGKSVTFETDSFEEGKYHQVHAFKTGPEMFGAVFADITEGKKMRLSLASEKIMISTLINSITDFIFSKDINGRYTACNDSFARLFVGRPVAEIIGKTDRELFGEKESVKLNFILEKDREVFKKGENIKVEWEAKLADGRIVKLETIKTRFKDESGKLSGLVGVSRDITERDNAEKELKERVRSSEILNKVMVDREIKMIELKKEIANLKKSIKPIKTNEK
jgi:PAS domain S-box-containing protein